MVVAGMYIQYIHMCAQTVMPAEPKGRGEGERACKII